MICKFVESFSVLSASLPVTFIHIPRNHPQNSVTMLLVILKLSVIGVTVDIFIGPFTVSLTILPEPAVDITIRVSHDAIAASFVSEPLTLILGPICMVISLV